MIILDVLPFHDFCSWGRLCALKLASGGYDYFHCRWSSYRTLTNYSYFLGTRMGWIVLYIIFLEDSIIKIPNLLKYYIWCAIITLDTFFINNIHTCTLCTDHTLDFPLDPSLPNYPCHVKSILKYRLKINNHWRGLKLLHASVLREIHRMSPLNLLYFF